MGAGNGLLDFVGEKTQFFSFDLSNSPCTIYMNMNGSVLGPFLAHSVLHSFLVHYVLHWKDSALVPTLFLLYINDFPDDVICNIAFYADDTALYSKCDQASDLWQQLELASKLQSDLRDTVEQEVMAGFDLMTHDS